MERELCTERSTSKTHVNTKGMAFKRTKSESITAKRKAAVSAQVLCHARENYSKAGLFYKLLLKMEQYWTIRRKWTLKVANQLTTGKSSICRLYWMSFMNDNGPDVKEHAVITMDIDTWVDCQSLLQMYVCRCCPILTNNITETHSAHLDHPNVASARFPQKIL